MVQFDPAESRRALWGHLAWFLMWAGTTAFAVYLQPNPAGHGTHTQLGLAPCPSTIFFSRPCPGCGLTTSFTAFVHGRWDMAFRAHWFGPVFYVLFTLSALACLYGFIKKRRFNTDSKAFSMSLMALVLTYLAYSGIRFAVMDTYRPAPPVVR